MTSKLKLLTATAVSLFLIASGSSARAAVSEIKPGDVIWIPPGVKHWHGATATSGMTHIAIQGAVDVKNVDWMEKVIVRSNTT